MAKPLMAISSLEELLEYIEERHTQAGARAAVLVVASRKNGIVTESKRELAAKEAECNVLNDIKTAIQRIMGSSCASPDSVSVQESAKKMGLL